MLHSQNYSRGRQGTVPGGNGNHSENYSHISASNRHQISEKYLSIKSLNISPLN